MPSSSSSNSSSSSSSAPPPLQHVSSALDLEAPYSDPASSSEVDALLEPTDEMQTALALCKAKFGGLRLNMGSMRLAFVPFEVKYLTDLRILNLRGNRLSMFPSELCAALNDLETLNLSSNVLSYLPENISALSNLRSLNLGDNSLSQLPLGLFSLPALQELRLDRNRLEAIPGQVGDLHALSSLVLHHNYIRVVPARMDELKHLTHVDLSENPIEVCPGRIMTLHRKNELLLHKSKRRGLIKRSQILKKTMDENLEAILLSEKDDIAKAKLGLAATT